ncbi:MAG: RNHCP domain-containing protein [Anaerolineales bacterium]|nr:RNHCP domain-containing protein [Anaerolineales bacterium]
MGSRKFQRKIEDFFCEQCGTEVKGTGFTNHCPHCLWSKHVDVNPGDRDASCQGMMEPVSVESYKDHYRILHRCQRCGMERYNKSSPEDNFDKLLEIARNYPRKVLS